MSIKNGFLLFFLSAPSYFISTAFAQSGQQHDLSVIDESSWVIPKNDTLDYGFDSYKNAKAFMLKRKIQNFKSASVAYPKNLNFQDGTIEADIASPQGGAGFVGLAFRIKDEHHYETIYFRPGSSNTPEAVQYMPEIKPEFNWWNYEDSIHESKAVIPLTDWFHVRVLVKGNTLTVFVNGDDKPVMIFKGLDPGLKNGSVGFWLGNCPVGAYKNLTVTAS
jgi:hypothetical protein